jgi:hypothetical protein
MSFSILEECEQTKLAKRELYWIKFYDAYNHGYNGTTATGKGGKHPAELRGKMAKAAKKVGRRKLVKTLRSENAKKQHAVGNLGQSCWKPGTAERVGNINKGRKKKKIPCKVCGGFSWLKHNDEYYCFAHDPLPDRNKKRNAGRRKAQKEISTKTRSAIAVKFWKNLDRSKIPKRDKAFSDKMSKLMKKRWKDGVYS